MKSPTYATHDMNFDYIVMDLVFEAYKNDKMNQGPNTRRTKGTGKHKKSPMQNGNASVACLLLYIIMESAIRRKFYFLSEANRSSAHSKLLFDRYKIINQQSKHLKEIENYLDELTLIRDAIVHAYIFEGEIALNDDHEIIGISERAVSGKNKNKIVRRLTPKLRLHTAPNQISFKDIAIYYVTVSYILEDAKLGMPHMYWVWKPGDDIEPVKWLKRAMKSLKYGRTKVWLSLLEKLDEAEYQDFIIGLEDAGFDLNQKL